MRYNEYRNRTMRLLTIVAILATIVILDTVIVCINLGNSLSEHKATIKAYQEAQSELLLTAHRDEMSACWHDAEDLGGICELSYETDDYGVVKLDTVEVTRRGEL